MSDAYIERLLIDAQANIDQATDNLDTLGKMAGKVEESDPTITPQVDPKPATEGLGKVADATEGAGGKAGQRFGANFIRDVGASIGGGAEGAAADLADGLSTAVESLGIGEKLAGQIIGGFTAAFGIATIGYFGIKKLFDFINASADESKHHVEAITQALASADVAQAAKALTDTYGGLIDKAKGLGVSTATVTAFIAGQSNSLGDLDGAYQRHLDNQAKAVAIAARTGQGVSEVTAQLDDQAASIAGQLVPSLQQAQGEWAKSSSNLAQVQRQQFEMTKQLGATTSALLDQASHALPAVRTEILNYIAVQNGIPLSRITEIQTDADPNDIAQVQAELDALTQARTVAVHADLVMTQQMLDFIAALKQGQTVASAILGSVNLAQQATTQATRAYQRLNGPTNIW